MCGYARHRTCSETSLHRQPRDFGHRDWDPQVGLVGWVEFGICWPFKTSFLRGTCRFLLKQDLGVVSQVKSKSKYPRNPLKIGWTITGTYWKKCAIIAGDSVHWRCSMKLSHPNVPLISTPSKYAALHVLGTPIRHLGQHPNIVQLIDVYDNEGGATRFQHSLPGTFGGMGKWNSFKSYIYRLYVYIYIYIEMQASLYGRINHEANATTIWEWYVFERYSVF